MNAHFFSPEKILTKHVLRPPPAPPRPRPAPSKKSRPEPESPEKEVFPLLFLFFFPRVGTISFVETNITSHQYEPELWRPEIKTRRVNTREVLLPLAYLIFVIFFTLAKFLENKIYNEKRQFFALIL